MARRRDDEIRLDETPVFDLELDEDSETPRPAPSTGRPGSSSRLRGRAPPPGRPAPLASRATGRPKSAQQALADARRSEKQPASVADAQLQAKRDHARRVSKQAKLRAEHTAKVNKQAADRAAAQRRNSEAQAARDRAMFAPRQPADPTQTGEPLGTINNAGRAEAVLSSLDLAYEFRDLYPDLPVSTLLPLWQAHVLRARHEGDLQMVATAHAVVTSLQERPDSVLACRIAVAGKEWAVWLDLHQARVIAALQPSDLYLIAAQ